MGEVVELRPNVNGAEGLRAIADMMDKGELPNEATVICATDVFHVGVVDDGVAATNAIFNMTIGIAKLANAVVDSIEDE